MKNNQMMITVGVAIVIGSLAFFGGMKYQQSKSPTLMSGQFAQNSRGQAGSARFGAAGQARGNRAFGGSTTGEITSLDASSMTVKLQDGSSKIVNLSGTTMYNKAAEGTKSDLKVGDRVAAFGTAGSDGSVTAQSVQINPQMRMRGMPSGTPTPTK